MAVYGQGQMLGAGVDPRMFVQDYSGFTRAAEIQAQGMQNLGASIAKAVEGYQEGKKESSKLNAIKKTTLTQIDSAINLYGDRIPGLKDSLLAQKAQIENPNSSLYEQATSAGIFSSQLDDLLNRDIKSRAIAVQEAQMGMRPAYFGGGRQTPAISYGSGAISRAASMGGGGAIDMSAGDQALQNQPEGSQWMIPEAPDEAVVPGTPPGASVNLDAERLNSMLQKLAKLRQVSADENKRYVTNFADSVVAQNEQGAKQVLNDLADQIKKASEGYEVKPNQTAVTIETPSGSFSAIPTVGGDYINQETGDVIDAKTGEAKKFGGVRLLSQDDLNKAQDIYDASMGGGDLLPPLDQESVPGQLPDNFNPQSSIGTLEERAMVQRMVAEGQGRAMVQNMPQGAISTDPSMAFDMVQPQPAQSRVMSEPPFQGFSPNRMSPMERQITMTAPTKKQPSKDELIKEYNNITTLNPYQQDIVNEAKIEASQSGTAPNKAVSTELERNILFNRAFVPTSLPKQGVRIVTPEDKKRQSNALLAQAKTRTVDRVMAYELMSRFDTIQQILNHPDASEFFGQSLPEEKIKDLAREQGGIYALYANLKGQDLVGALADIKEKSGTAAGMAASETKALQEAANPLLSTQDWESAKKTLMKLSADVIRSGKKLGLTGVFSYVDPKDRSKGFKAQELLRSTNEFDPIFEDEVEYYNKVDKLKSQIEGVPQQPATPQQTRQTQPVQPSYNPYTNSFSNLNKQFFGR